MGEQNGSTALVRTTNANVPPALAVAVDKNVPEITSVLPKDVSFEKFQAGLWLQFQPGSKLEKCTPLSLVKATIKAAIAGHIPGRDCHIQAFCMNRGKPNEYYEATMIEWYQGLLRALDRTGRVLWAKAEPVYKQDHFVCDELAELAEFRRYRGPDRGALECYFSAIKLLGQDKPLVRLSTLDEVDKVRRNAPGGEQDAWQKWPEEMGRKTALKKQAKYLRLIDDVPEENKPVVTYEEARVLIADTHGDHDAASAARERAIRHDPLPEVVVDAMPPPVKEHIREDPPRKQTKQEVSLLANANKLVHHAALERHIDKAALWVAVEELAQEAMAPEKFDRDHLTPKLYGMVGTWSLEAGDRLMPKGTSESEKGEAPAALTPHAKIIAWVQKYADTPELQALLSDVAPSWRTDIEGVVDSEVEAWILWAGKVLQGAAEVSTAVE